MNGHFLLGEDKEVGSEDEIEDVSIIDFNVIPQNISFLVEYCVSPN